MRKRKLKSLIGFLLALFLLCGCDEESIVLGAESQWVAVETDIFSFELVEATPEHIVANIINHSTETLCWGSYMALEKNVDGVWYELEAQPPEGTVLAWNCFQYMLESGAEREIGYNFEVFGGLPAGEYRIVKEFGYEKPSKEAWVVACEFTIEE